MHLASATLFAGCGVGCKNAEAVVSWLVKGNHVHVVLDSACDDLCPVLSVALVTVSAACGTGSEDDKAILSWQTCICRLLSVM